MKVKTYIGLLSSGSLGGALFVGVFGWWMLTSINQSTQELEEESRNSGASSSEYQDIQAFLSTSRGIFEALEIYPESYAGVYGVAKDRIVMAKEGLRSISQKVPVPQGLKMQGPPTVMQKKAFHKGWTNWR